MSARIEAQDEKLLAERRQRAGASARQLRASTSELEERATRLERQSEDHLRACEQLVIQLGGQ